MIGKAAVLDEADDADQAGLDLAAEESRDLVDLRVANDVTRLHHLHVMVEMLDDHVGERELRAQQQGQSDDHGDDEAGQGRELFLPACEE